MRTVGFLPLTYAVSTVLKRRTNAHSCIFVTLQRIWMKFCTVIPYYLRHIWPKIGVKILYGARDMAFRLRVCFFCRTLYTYGLLFFTFDKRSLRSVSLEVT